MAYRQMTVESEAGPYQMWVDDATGQTTTTNPYLAGAGLGYSNEMRQGPDGAMIDTRLVNSIGGVSPDQFQTRVKADGRLETFNPTTGQWEKTYRAPFDMAGGNQFLPESIGKPIGGAFIEFNKPAENSGGFFEDYALPAIVGGIGAAGVGSMLGAGSLFGGASSAGTGAADWMGSAFTPGAGTAAGTGSGVLSQLAQNGGGGMDWTSEAFGDFGSAVDAGSGYTIDMAGRAIDATGNVVNGTDGSIMDFVKGAIQSGNYAELAKVMPSLPTGTQTAIKALLGGSGASGTGSGGSDSSWLSMLGRAVPGLLGAYGANQQTNALSDLAKQFGEYGAPSRARYEASMTPGFDPTSIPGYQGALDTASQSILRKLSATGGNPYGNPGGLIEANKQIVSGTALPAIQQYQNQNANTGGLGSLAAAYPGAQTAATQSTGNIYANLGGAAADVFNPKPAATSLTDIYKMLNSGMKAA